MKLTQIYDRQAFERFADSCNNMKFKDGVILSRELTKVDPTLIEKKYPENVFMNSGFDISNFGGYANTIQSLRIIGKGGFKTGLGAGDDKGLISLNSEDSEIKVFERTATAVWNDTEIQQAAMQGVNIASRYVSEIDKVYKQDLDQSGLVGLETGQYGILNHPDIPAAALASAIGSGTAQNDYDLMAAYIIAQYDAVNNTPEYMATKLFMPSTVYNHLKKTMMDTAAGTATILKALMDNFPEVDFVVTPRAQNVGGGRVMSFVSTSADAMKLRIPVPLKNAPLFTQGFNYSTDYLYRIAGIDILEKFAGRIATGV